MVSIINDKWWHKLWNEIIISNHPEHVLHINSAIVITVIASSSLPVGRWSLSNACTFSVHYSDVITSTVASQITGVSIVCSTVQTQIKPQSSESLALCVGNPPAIGFPSQRPATRKMFPFDDAIMWYVGNNAFYVLVPFVLFTEGSCLVD